MSTQFSELIASGIPVACRDMAPPLYAEPTSVSGARLAVDGDRGKESQRRALPPDVDGGALVCGQRDRAQACPRLFAEEDRITRLSRSGFDPGGCVHSVADHGEVEPAAAAA